MNKKLMKEVGFSEEMKLVEEKKCPFCKTNIDKTKFRDELSLKEFEISGLCQKCQDKMFEE